jgi:hypothetical protein
MKFSPCWAVSDASADEKLCLPCGLHEGPMMLYLHHAVPGHEMHCPFYTKQLTGQRTDPATKTKNFDTYILLWSPVHYTNVYLTLRPLLRMRIMTFPVPLMEDMWGWIQDIKPDNILLKTYTQPFSPFAAPWDGRNRAGSSSQNSGM